MRHHRKPPRDANAPAVLLLLLLRYLKVGINEIIAHKLNPQRAQAGSKHLHEHLMLFAIRERTTPHTNVIMRCSQLMAQLASPQLTLALPLSLTLWHYVFVSLSVVIGRTSATQRLFIDAVAVILHAAVCASVAHLSQQMYHTSICCTIQQKKTICQILTYYIASPFRPGCWVGRQWKYC